MIIDRFAKSFAQNEMVMVLALLVVLAPASGCMEIMPNNDSSDKNTISGDTGNTSGDVETRTAVQTSSPTPTVTKSPTPEKEFDKEDKYQFFRDGYANSLKDHNISVLNSTVDSKDSRLSIAYEMKNPDSNISVGEERENITLTYAVAVKYFIENNRTYMNESWAPKYLNVTAATPNGRIYETAYTTREWAKSWIKEDFSTDSYILEYYGTIEPGPANPDYEG